MTRVTLRHLVLLQGLAKSGCSLRKWTHDQSEGPIDSKDSAHPPKRAAKKEREADDQESTSSTGPSEETLQDHRFTVYSRDSIAVQEVMAKILGLESGSTLSQQDLDSSQIFPLRRAADEAGQPSIIGQHWVPFWREKTILQIAHPRNSPTRKDGCLCTRGQA